MIPTICSLKSSTSTFLTLVDKILQMKNCDILFFEGENYTYRHVLKNMYLFFCLYFLTSCYTKASFSRVTLKFWWNLVEYEKVLQKDKKKR